MHLDVLLMTLAGISALWYVYHRDRVAARRQRAVMFATLLPHLQQPRLHQDDVDFPVLSGRRQGYDVKIEPVADHIGYRKLPSLWLRITVSGKIPYAGVFDFLARPENIEFYSPAFSLDHIVAVPLGWPQHSTLRSDSPEHMPPAELMDRHMQLFQDPRAKELLVTPRGVRIVYLANQAQRPHYLVLRSVSFEDLNVQPDLVCRLLDAAIAVHRDLNQETLREAATVG